MKKLFVTSALALIAAVPAMAQDEAPVSFTGAWVAVGTGLDVLRLKEGDDSETSKGVLFGGSIGYDVASGNTVFGVEGEISSSTQKQKFSNLVTAGDALKITSGADYYAGVRVGMRSGNNGLFYIKGGYVNSSIKSDYRGTVNLETTDKSDGYRVGLGYELAGKQVFGRAEVRYQDLGEFKMLGVNTGVDRSNAQFALLMGVRF